MLLRCLPAPLLRLCCLPALLHGSRSPSQRQLSTLYRGEGPGSCQTILPILLTTPGTCLRSFISDMQPDRDSSAPAKPQTRASTSAAQQLPAPLLTQAGPHGCH